MIGAALGGADRSWRLLKRSITSMSSEQSGALDLSCGRGRWWWRSDVEQEAATQQRSGPFTVGQEAEATDANEAFGQDVDEETSQELIGCDGHDLPLAAGCVVLPAEGDAIAFEADQAMVGDGDAVRVAGEIVEDMFGSAERRLGIDDPVLGEELPEETLEAFRHCKISTTASISRKWPR